MLEQRFAEILADVAPVFYAPVRLKSMLRSAQLFVTGQSGDPWIEAWMRGNEWPCPRVKVQATLKTSFEEEP